MFTPTFREDSHFLIHIFQMGWFNHQLENFQGSSRGGLNSMMISTGGGEGVVSDLHVTDVFFVFDVALVSPKNGIL